MNDYRMNPSGASNWGENSARFGRGYRSARQRQAQLEVVELVNERALMLLAIEERARRRALAGRKASTADVAALAEKINSRRLA